MAKLLGIRVYCSIILTVFWHAGSSWAVVVPGLDRLPGSAIEGMSDELWVQHSQELVQLFESGGGSVSLKEFAKDFTGFPPARQTEAMIQWDMLRDMDGKAEVDESNKNSSSGDKTASDSPSVRELDNNLVVVISDLGGKGQHQNGLASCEGKYRCKDQL